MPIALAPIAPAPIAPAHLHHYGRASAAGLPRDVTRANARSDDEAEPDHDAGFVALQAAYRGHGGIAQGDALAARLGRAGCGGFVDLARRIVAGELFSFHWHDSFWVPLFQFDPVLLMPRAPPRRVLGELHGVFDGWEIADWYVRGNDDLHGRRPLDLLDTELDAVLGAARAARYLADA